MLVLGHEDTDVCPVIDFGFSLHVTNRSQRVDALIGGYGVAMMLDTIKGHQKVIVYQGESILSYHLIVVISDCLSFHFLSLCL